MVIPKLTGSESDNPANGYVITPTTKKRILFQKWPPPFQEKLYFQKKIQVWVQSFLVFFSTVNFIIKRLLSKKKENALQLFASYIVLYDQEG